MIARTSLLGMKKKCEERRAAAPYGRPMEVDSILFEQLVDAALAFDDLTNERLPPSTTVFATLAKLRSVRLIAFVHDASLTSGMRARAIEALADAYPKEMAIDILLPILGSDAPPLMQEAVVLGLERYVDDGRVAAAIHALAANPDTSPGLRETARDVVED